jgi:uncharacterized protein (UPF0332 family)
LSQFNIHYIKPEIAKFHRGDYKEIASVERIRNNSDYDDFYIADKEECEKVVKVAEEFFAKAKQTDEKTVCATSICQRMIF